MAYYESIEQYYKTDRWKRIASARMDIDNHQCCMCGCRGCAGNELEVHHLRYKGVLFHEDESDYLYTMLITLCRHCHTNVHHMMNRVTASDGRRGWQDRPTPYSHAYSLDGQTTEYTKRFDE